MSESERRQHVAYQARYFDEHHEVFRQPIPDDVVERTKEIIAAVPVGENTRVLDVGTGMGVLIQHFLARGAQAKNIVGCDLSAQMLGEARRRYPNATFWQGDFAELPADFGNFDVVMFNACFGNFFDSERTAGNAIARLNDGGRLVISHPMGNGFVQELKAHDPKLVLRPLPSKHELDAWCERWAVRLETFRDEPTLYLAVLAR